MLNFSIGYWCCLWGVQGALNLLDLVSFDADTFSQAVHAKGAAIQNCCRFIDGTVRPIAQPKKNQRVMFSDHKRVHCIKFQVCACWYACMQLIKVIFCTAVSCHTQWHDCPFVWAHELRADAMMHSCWEQVGLWQNCTHCTNKVANTMLSMVIQFINCHKPSWIDNTTTWIQQINEQSSS